MSGFWATSLVVAVLALLVCRRWARFAFVVLPLSVAFPFALASSEGPNGARFPAVQTEHILAACALVLIANLVGMGLGKFQFVFFHPFERREEPATKQEDDRPS